MTKRVGVFLMAVLALTSWARADYLVVAYPFCELLQYDDAGNYVGTFTAAGAVASGTSITADPSGRVYYGNVSGVVSRFNGEGAWDSWYQQQVSGQIYGILARDDAVFVCDATNNVVLKYDPAQSAGGGVVLDSGSFTVSSPHGICQDETGRIYVANKGTGSVLRWNADGTFDSEVIPAGEAPNCVDLAVGPDGYLWVLRVASKVDAHLVRFNQDGTYAGLFRTLGESTGIEYANSVYVSPYGETMISASTGIHVYDADSDTWSTFIALGSGGLSAPYGVVHIGEVKEPIPFTYSRPAQIYHGTATVDGDLAEWTDVEWASLNKDYAELATDVDEAYYAARWDATANKMYVAVKVKDTAHWFTDTYTGWNKRDAVELYIHTTGTGAVNYFETQASAQQYMVGINTNQDGVWTTIGGENEIPTWADFSAAGAVDGEWLYYEAAITPFEEFSLIDSNACVEDTFDVNDIVGLDVCVAAHDDLAYTGVKSENLMTGKSVDYKAIGLHKLADTLPTVQVVNNVPVDGDVYPQGWTFSPSGVVNGGGELVEGPDTVPAGTGSAKLILGDDVNSAMRLKANVLDGVNLADITELTFDTYNVATQDCCYLSFIVDRLGDGSDEGHDADDDVLLFVQYCNDQYVTPMLETWQRWDTLNAKWFYDENGVQVVRSWDEILAASPNAKIIPGGMRIGIGGWGDPGQIACVDRVVIKVSGQSSVLYDFEPAALIPGDANCDGMVDVGDLGILAANYGSTDKTWAEGDFNDDGAVDVGDLGILAAHYGEGVSGAVNFDADYAKAFGETVADDDAEADDADGSICSGLGLPLIVGLLLAGLMLVKLEE